MEIKLEGFSVEADRGFAGSRVDMVSGLLALGADAVAVAEVGAHASVLISGVRWSWVVGDSG